MGECMMNRVDDDFYSPCTDMAVLPQLRLPLLGGGERDGVFVFFKTMNYGEINDIEIMC